jgi:SAM-dependent methyltransferase
MASSVSRQITPAAFDAAYRQVILGNHFFEEPRYYLDQRPRYRKTLSFITRLDLPRPAKILEIGGGQLLLLCHRMFGDTGLLADVGSDYADAVTRFGLDFTACDLLRDDLPSRGEFDLIVLCEVIEHLPVPAHLILAKMRHWLKPGGYLLLTTPNLYRMRNVVRLAMGMELFCPLFYPPRGQSLGHPMEFSRANLRWHVERAGLAVKSIDHVQLSNRGSSVVTKAARLLISPLQLRPAWRDSLVAVAQRPLTDLPDGDAADPFTQKLIEMISQT